MRQQGRGYARSHLAPRGENERGNHVYIGVGALLVIVIILLLILLL